MTIIMDAGEHEKARENSGTGGRTASNAKALPAQGHGKPWPAGHHHPHYYDDHHHHHCHHNLPHYDHHGHHQYHNGHQWQNSLTFSFGFLQWSLIIDQPRYERKEQCTRWRSSLTWTGLDWRQAAGWGKPIASCPGSSKWQKDNRTKRRKVFDKELFGLKVLTMSK